MYFLDYVIDKVLLYKWILVIYNMYNKLCNKFEWIEMEYISYFVNWKYKLKRILNYDIILLNNKDKLFYRIIFCKKEIDIIMLNLNWVIKL